MTKMTIKQIKIKVYGTVLLYVCLSLLYRIIVNCNILQRKDFWSAINQKISCHECNNNKDNYVHK